MKMMKAIGILHEAQSNDLTLMDIAIPTINKNEVLVHMQAIGVGSHDRWFRPSNAKYPYPIGIEGAGTIVEIGENVKNYIIGDQVLFINNMQPKGGTWANFSAISEDALISMPNGLSFIDAAALPVAGKAALEGIKALGLQAGDTVFIAGASGAIGTLAIQLAVADGYRVASSASEKNHAYMLSLGAEKVVDYVDETWAEQVRLWMPDGVDAALAIQPGTGVTSMKIVKDGGKVITISGDQFETERQITAEQITHHPEIQRKLITLATEVADGHIRIIVEQVYPFEQGLEALKKVEARHAQGKIVLKME